VLSKLSIAECNIFIRSLNASCKEENTSFFLGNPMKMQKKIQIANRTAAFEEWAKTT